MIDPADVTASILAGGASSRMGRDKALLSFKGKPFISHIADTLSMSFTDINVIANNDTAYQFLHLPIFADIYKNCGPLGGIHTALSRATLPYVFITSCDVPLISDGVVSSVLEVAMHEEVTIVSDGSRVQPLVGIYPSSLQRVLQEHLEAGEKRVNTFLNECGVNVSVIALPHFHENLRNINTQDEFASVQ